MSDTPRTDAFASNYINHNPPGPELYHDFARQLERELNEARETISQCIERIRKEETKASGCGRASIAAERHCKRISTERDQWKAMAQEAIAAIPVPQPQGMCFGHSLWISYDKLVGWDGEDEAARQLFYAERIIAIGLLEYKEQCRQTLSRFNELNK